MVSLDLIVSFAAAARHASFAAAARELGMSPSAIAKNIARMEAQLGVRLFHRTTRQVALSPDGQELHARCLHILDEIDALEASAAGTRSAVRGMLRIDVPATYGRQVVMPVLATMIARHPELQFDVRFSDLVSDIVREGLDAAVRIGPITDSRLVARQFDQQALWTCASPEYLAAHGEPESPNALSRHRCLVFRLPTSGRDRPWQFRAGRRDITLSPDSAMRLGDGEALVAAAVAGLGLIQVPDYMAARAVQGGCLKEVLPNFRPPPLPVSLVYPSHRRIPPRVRALAEMLAGTR